MPTLRTQCAAGFACLLAMAALVFVAGCGGGRSPSGSAKQTVSKRGGMRVSLDWPAPSRQIPIGSNSVVIVVTAPDGTRIDSRLLTRPALGGVTSAAFSNLPPGMVNVTASAYPGLDGSGVAQATATVAAEIQSGVVTDLPMTLESVITALTVTPAEWKAKVKDTQTFTVTGRNAAGEVVLVAPTRLAWFSSPNLTISDFGEARAISVGEGSLTVYDQESSGITTVPVDVQPLSDDYRVVSVANNGMVYSAASGKFYAILGAGGGDKANSMVTVDPTTGALGDPVSFGSEPTTIAASDDGKVLYIGFRVEQKIARFHVETNATEQAFPLNAPGGSGDFGDFTLQVQPGRPEGVLVSGTYRYIDIYFHGFYAYAPLCVFFSDGVQVGTGIGGVHFLTWGESPQRLYGYGKDQYFGPDRNALYAVTADGAGLNFVDFDDSAEEGLLGYPSAVVYDGGKLFGTTGQVVDPLARRVLGTCRANGAVAPAVNVNRVYYAESVGPDVVLKAFDVTTFQSVGELTLAGVSKFNSQYFMRWGAKGLACANSRQMVFIPNAPGF